MIRRTLSRLARQSLGRLGAAFGSPMIEQNRRLQKAMLERIGELRVELLVQTRQTQKRLERMTGRLSDRLNELVRAHDETRLIVKRLGSRDGDRRSNGSRVPKQVGVQVAWRKPVESEIPTESILQLVACPLCGEDAATEVCEYNKFLLLRAPIDAAATVYRYALCHRCGIVYARHRPVGPRYRYLVERFEETLGRIQPGAEKPKNAALSSAALDVAERSELSVRLKKGVFVSEHDPTARKAFVPALLSDRLANAAHVEILGSLLPLRSPRVLELRPRLGSIGAALRRLYDAEVYAVPLFEGQQFLIKEAYGIPADHLLDYDRFAVGYSGNFDLIIANHILTHALRPRDLFTLLRERLNPGGHLYLYNEADEGGFLAKDKKSMINSLNPFHMQTFDAASMTRAMSAVGFEPVFVSHHRGALLALLRSSVGPASWEPMSDAEREARVAQYKRARDWAILRLAEPLRVHFATEWNEVVERAFMAGMIDFDEEGALRLRKASRAD